MALSILGVLLIGWFVPRLAVRASAARWVAVLGVLAAWAIGFAYVYGAAWLTSATGGLDLKDEIEKAVNAWKLILLVAPASALHHRRKASDPPEGDR